MISIKDNFPTGIEFGDNKCSCGHNKFIMFDNGKGRDGVYCRKCGKWLKWPSKNEVRLFNEYIRGYYGIFQ